MYGAGTGGLFQTRARSRHAPAALLGSNLEIQLLLCHESMNATLCFREACPTSGAFIYAVSRLSRAWPAADGAITPIVQRVIGNLVLLNVLPDRVTTPIRHRIELHDLAPGGLVKNIDFYDVDA